MTAQIYEYDVALSFAGEDRAYVEQVANCLKNNSVKVFYDAYETVELWGKDLYTHLDEVYRLKSKYCVLFISKFYKDKLWTNHERESTQARAFEENREYILPARFDETEIPGIRPTIGYVNLSNVNPTQLCRLIIEKLSSVENESERTEVVSFKMPRLANAKFGESDECYKLFKEVERFIDERSSALESVAVEVNKSTFDISSVTYRFEYKGNLLYVLSFWVDSEFGRNFIGFHDGWRERSGFEGKSYTAMLYVKSDANISEPIIEMQNFSLLNPGASFDQISKEQLLEGIWDKAITIIEQAASQIKQ